MPASTHRSRWLRTLGSLLAVVGVVLAAATLFTFANGMHADRIGTARQREHAAVVVTEAAGRGQWHWIGPDGRVGEKLGADAVIVPGDRIGFVDDAGYLTETTFALPPEAGNETQGTAFAVPDGNNIYRLAPITPGRFKFERSPLWIVVAAGSAATLAGSGALLLASDRARHAATGAAAP